MTRRLLLLLVLALALAACDRDKTISTDSGASEASTENDDITFSDLVEGQSMVFTPEGGDPLCMRFTDEWRYELYDAELMEWLPGDYADVSDRPNEPGTEGALSFTTDPANDPAEAELVIGLVFAWEIAGTYESTYSEGGEEDQVVQGDFEIVEGLIDGAECPLGG